MKECLVGMVLKDREVIDNGWHEARLRPGKGRTARNSMTLWAEGQRISR